jgi:hypothetical protein
VALCRDSKAFCSQWDKRQSQLVIDLMIGKMYNPMHEEELGVSSHSNIPEGHSNILQG